MIKLIPIKNDCEKVYIFINDINIGKLNYYVTKVNIVINYILIYDAYKRNGFGKDIVNYLMNKHKGRNVVGDALPEAVEFWRKMNARFSNPIPSKRRPEVLLTPFIIEY